VDEVVVRAWRDGVSGSDEAALRRAASGEARVLANLAALIGGAVPAPSAPIEHAAASLDAADRIVRAWTSIRGGDRAAIAVALADLEIALARRSPDDLRWSQIDALVDLALGELARLTGDRVAAIRRWTAASTGRGGVALRIAAELRVAGAAESDREIAAERGRVGRVRNLARALDRRGQLADAALVAATLAVAVDDDQGARDALAEIPAPARSPAARVFAELLDRTGATPPIAEALASAAIRGDALEYAQCAIAGSRMCAGADRDADAVLIVTAAIAYLDSIASGLASRARA
jgi:hypothetical protein